MNYYPLEELELDKEGINKKEDQKEEEEEEEETYLQKFINDNYYYILILLVIIISLSINTILDYQLMGKKLIQTGGYKRGMIPFSNPLKGKSASYTDKGYNKLSDRQKSLANAKDTYKQQKKIDSKINKKEARKEKRSKMLSSLGSSTRHGAYGIVYTAGSIIFSIIIGMMVLIVFAPSLALVAVIFFSFRMIIPKILEMKEL